jgi:hypothetical protein
MPKRPMSRLLPVLFPALLVVACGTYDVTVNDAVVYRPKGLFSDFQIADAALGDCVTQSIVDGDIREATQLEQLNCSDAGIESLQGLATFTGLTHLKLSGNRIRNLMELAGLTRLQELYLDGNVVIDPVPLYPLPALRVLDLSDNDGLQCPEDGRFARLQQLSLPTRCTATTSATTSEPADRPSMTAHAPRAPA